MVKWNNEALKIAFYRGLKEEVKDELIKVDRDKTELNDYYNEAIKIDERI